MTTTNSNKLTEIADFTRGRIARARSQLPLELLWDQVSLSPNPHSVLGAFRTKGVHIIAEIKRQSPSRGKIAVAAEPLDIASEYLKAGATALSVLTEPEYFGGDITFLSRIRTVFPNSLLLMKDFIIDEYQLIQARLAGADMVLLMVNLLGSSQLYSFYEKARELGLTPLVEVHDETELTIARDLGAELIGINNRDLKTLEVSLQTSELLAKHLPTNAIAISESGIKEGFQVKELRSLGYQGFLVGTSLMEQPSPGEALRTLLRTSQ